MGEIIKMFAIYTNVGHIIWYRLPIAYMYLRVYTLYVFQIVSTFL